MCAHPQQGTEAWPVQVGADKGACAVARQVGDEIGNLGCGGWMGMWARRIYGRHLPAALRVRCIEPIAAVARFAEEETATFVGGGRHLLHLLLNVACIDFKQEVEHAVVAHHSRQLPSRHPCVAGSSARRPQWCARARRATETACSTSRRKPMLMLQYKHGPWTKAQEASGDHAKQGQSTPPIEPGPIACGGAQKAATSPGMGEGKAPAAAPAKTASTAAAAVATWGMANGRLPAPRDLLC